MTAARKKCGGRVRPRHPFQAASGAIQLDFGRWSGESGPSMKIPASLRRAVSKAQKLAWSLRWVGQNLTDPSSPLRYVYGWYSKARRPREVLQRKLQARRFTAELDPEVAKA